MIPWSETRRKILADPAVQAVELEPEWLLSLEIAKARAVSGLTQGEIAARMGTTQSAVARLESGRAKPSFRTLEKYAAATGARLVISLETPKSETPKRETPKKKRRA